MSSSMELPQNLKIALKHILSATNNFGEESIIGRGGFGKVYRGELPLPDSDACSVVAIKRLDPASMQGDREFGREIGMLLSCRHENLVSLLGCCIESDEKILVYEYASNGSLDKLLDSIDLTWKQRLNICLDAARGLKYLHHDVGEKHRVIHCDIKSANILLDKNWKAKVSDFGLSKLAHANIKFSLLVTRPSGTFGYVDPEYLNTGSLTKESDVFSFGVVLFEVLCGRLAYVECNDDSRVLFHLARQHYERKTLDEIINPNLGIPMSSASLYTFSAIAYRCINKCRADRPTMIQVVEELEEALSQEAQAQAPEPSLSKRVVLSWDRSFWFTSDWSGDKWKLDIFGIEEVESGKKRKSVKLDDTSRIECLHIEWIGNGEDTQSNIDEDVFQGLTAHLELKVLKMTNFKGIKFSSWIFMKSVSLLQNLVEILLDRCEQVPTLGHLPNLKKVKMRGLNKVRKIGQEFYHYHEGYEVINGGKFFPELRELVLEEMYMLKEWVDQDVKQMYPLGSSSSLTNQAFQFPNLEKLTIWSCPNLISVSWQFPSLKQLYLYNVKSERLELQKLSTGCLTDLHLTRVHCEVEDTLEDLFKNNNRFLTNVKLLNCSQLTKLPSLVTDDDILLPSLRSLEIYYCDQVTHLPDLGRLTGLVWLKIGRFSDEIEIPTLPSSLQTLILWDWPKVQQLPQQRLENLSALTKLELSRMYRLEALPELPSLQELTICRCDKLTSMPTAEATRRLKRLEILDCPVLKERCVKEEGVYWPNIQHIPYIKITSGRSHE